MSANSNNADKTDLPSPGSSKEKPSEMDSNSNPSRYPTRGVMGEPIPESSRMAMSVSTTRPINFPSSVSQDRIHSSDLVSRPRNEECIRLPPIHTLNLEPRAQTLESDMSTKTLSYSTTRPLMHSAPYNTPPEHTLSPPLSNKRKRLSFDDDSSEARGHVVPQSYRNSPIIPPISSLGPISPSSPPRRGSFSSARTSFPTTEWTGLARTSPPYTVFRGISSILHPQTSEGLGYERSEWRPDLPRLPSFPSPNTTHPAERPPFDECSLDSARSNTQTYPRHYSPISQPPSPPYNPSSSSSSYTYQRPRGQSYSDPSAYSLHQDRTPFSANSHYGMHHGGAFSYSNMNGTEVHGDSKPRKRRGNLPKETTDKLRAWFMANLQHPYPTEDEKQEMMRRTGLQMNQISNWFINARRRHLPGILNNAQTETNATSAGVGRRAQGESSSDYGDERRSRENSIGYDGGFKRRKRDSI